jgi:hypothetical protein
MMDPWRDILYIFPRHQRIMKLFASKFTQTLILNVATIAAIVVGLYQFAVRAYNDNNGAEKTRKVMQTVLMFIDTLVQYGKVYFTEPAPAPVPIRKVAQRRTKVA